MNTPEATLSQNEKYLDEKLNIKEKQYFFELEKLITQKIKKRPLSLLDIGCATGDFLSFLDARKAFEASLNGIDVFPELLAQAASKLPHATFMQASVLDLPECLENSFDVITASGVMTLFSLDQLPAFFANIRRCLRENGLAVVFSPFNKYGVNVHVNHMVASEGGVSPQWETGYNCFSFQTIEEIVSPLFRSSDFLPFSLQSPDQPQFQSDLQLDH
jgi:ubiquinone/menaquinone biosynthesis C-methylase UbiE